MSDEQDYVLGQDVTQAAAARSQRGSVMLSVRLSADELARIEAFAEATGKSLSQVVREAVRNCLQMARDVQPDVTVSMSSGGTMSNPRPSLSDMMVPTEQRELVTT